MGYEWKLYKQTEYPLQKITVCDYENIVYPGKYMAQSIPYGDTCPDHHE